MTTEVAPYARNSPEIEVGFETLKRAQFRPRRQNNRLEILRNGLTVIECAEGQIDTLLGWRPEYQSFPPPSFLDSSGRATLIFAPIGNVDRIEFDYKGASVAVSSMIEAPPDAWQLTLKYLVVPPTDGLVWRTEVGVVKGRLLPGPLELLDALRAAR